MTRVHHKHHPTNRCVARSLTVEQRFWRISLHCFHWDATRAVASLLGQRMRFLEQLLCFKRANRGRRVEYPVWNSPRKPSVTLLTAESSAIFSCKSSSHELCGRRTSAIRNRIARNVGFSASSQEPSERASNFEGLDLDWQSISRRLTWRDGNVAGDRISVALGCGISLLSQHNVSPSSLCEMAEAAGAVFTPEEAQSFM